MDYSFGVVRSIGPDRISVIEPGKGTDEERECVYALTQTTKLQNAGSLEDIRPGQRIEVYSVWHDGVRTATMLTLEERFADDTELEYGETT